MKIIIAPDSMKGSLSALEIADIVAQAAQAILPDAEVLRMPIADGGEGTVDALVQATGGELRTARVTGPLGRPVDAAYGVLNGGRTAVIEMAQASGLPLMAGALCPLRATSRGTGELMRHALDAGIRDLLVGLGGSATNDGGAGLLMALGARLLDAEGNSIPDGGQGLEQIARIDLRGLDARLAEARITVLSDVTNPLLGPEGATHIYGPQKGAEGETLARLERGMAHYAGVLQRTLGRDVATAQGAGAAGGLGAALGGVLGGTMRSGIDAVLEAAGFEAALAGADLVITAEGRMDGQSVAFGKGPAGVGKRAKARGVPVIAIVGGMTRDAMAFCEGGLASIMALPDGPMSVSDAMDGAAALLASAAERMFRMLRIGMHLGGAG